MSRKLTQRYFPSPDDGVMGLSELPPPGTTRWVGRRKAAVVSAVRSGLLTLEETCERYDLTVEELMSWQRLLDRGGTPALRTTRLQSYRPATRRPPMPGRAGFSEDAD